MNKQLTGIVVTGIVAVIAVALTMRFAPGVLKSV